MLGRTMVDPGVRSVEEGVYRLLLNFLKSHYLFSAFVRNLGVTNMVDKNIIFDYILNHLIEIKFDYIYGTRKFFYDHLVKTEHFGYTNMIRIYTEWRATVNVYTDVTHRRYRYLVMYDYLHLNNALLQMCHYLKLRRVPRYDNRLGEHWRLYTINMMAPNRKDTTLLLEYVRIFNKARILKKEPTIRWLELAEGYMEFFNRYPRHIVITSTTRDVYAKK